MANVFSKKQGRPNKVKRNTYDLSFQNNLTTKFGQLTPVFCKEVLPGDTFDIKTAFNLKFMPTYFPLQTRMRADIHFFYVRNRNLWKDWPDFIGQTDPQSSFPVIAAQNGHPFNTSSLFDYLGVPTTKTSAETGVVTPVFGVQSTSVAVDNNPNLFIYPFSGSGLFALTDLGEFLGSAPGVPQSSDFSFPVSSSDDSVIFFTSLSEDLSSIDTVSYSVPPFNLFYGTETTIRNSSPSRPISVGLYYIKNGERFIISSHSDVSQNELNSYTDSIPSVSGAVLGFYISFERFSSSSSKNRLYIGSRSVSDIPTYIASIQDRLVDVGSSSPVLQAGLSALPFRAYESIYNAFYRDDRNNPFVLNGRKEYNKYITTDAGGSDNTPYKLMFRNWEQDFLTTAVPSPQQGVAPLVGITSTGTMTFADPDNPDKTYSVEAQTADDADTIVGVKYLENVPNSVQRSLIDVVSSGISINDFRNVNAYQRWLETNIRRGLKYKDQIKSHFDVNVSYAELDMPEFIGGVSQPVVPFTVNQTSEGSADSPLGSFAGTAQASGVSKHRVRHYCDEHGFIIGILSVVPVPNYSQLLPKYFLKKDSLDYFFPEFGKIGFQPIRNIEVAPMSSISSNTQNNVFGYQRPWYDYLSSVDEVHGDFRTSLRSFLLNRVFSGVPVLGPSFTIIDPDQLNDVFSYTEDTDKILGQIYFEVFAKRPIPQYGISQLEANI